MLMKNKLIALFLVLVLVVSFTACSQQPKEEVEPTPSTDEKAAFPITIVDSFDREITIESEPMRIISVAPSITETVFALGAGEKLVGRTDYCDYPQEAQKIESIGSLTEQNIEKIIDLKPDLVIASTHFKEEVLNKLEEADVKVAVFYGEQSFDGVYEVIQKVGKVLNKEDKAKNVITDMKNRVEDVLSRVKDLEKKEVYYVVEFGEYGDFTAGGDTFIGQLIEMAGGENAAGDVEGWKYSLEKLIEKNPDILICPNFDNFKDKLMKANGYKDLTAVKEGRVFEIDNDLLDLQGPRLVEGLEVLSEIIHPIK